MELSREITLLQQVGDETEYKEDMIAMFDHGMIVAKLTKLMASRLELSAEDISDITKAAMLHDIGKLKLSAYLYGRKDDFMDIDEIKYARMHPVLGRDIVSKAGIYNEKIQSYVYYHHENNDGTGYPERLDEENTPLGARILHVCDTYVSLVSERPFRAAYPKDSALAIMALESENYDMKLFMLLMDIVFSDEFTEIEEFVNQANERYRAQNKKD